MRTDSHDLTGAWDGVFSYSGITGDRDTTPFLANITDRSGVIEGSIIEPHHHRDVTMEAVIVGQRIGNTVHFSKDYNTTGDEYRNTVLYYGVLSADGDMITGEWRIGHWDGAFEMTRQASLGALVEENEEATA